MAAELQQRKRSAACPTSAAEGGEDPLTIRSHSLHLHSFGRPPHQLMEESRKCVDSNWGNSDAKIHQQVKWMH